MASESFDLKWYNNDNIIVYIHVYEETDRYTNIHRDTYTDTLMH